MENEEEALAFIESLRKKYWDATHNCYAYVVGERNEIQRCSDDGEPSGTAGRPMMDVLAGAGVHNAAVVVTRYFGGTLLGTGGLIRAYSLAVQEGLAAAEVITRIPGVKLKLTAEYTELGKIQYLLGERGLAAQEAVYTEKVELTVLVPEADAAGDKGISDRRDQRQDPDRRAGEMRDRQPEREIDRTERKIKERSGGKR